MPNNGTLRLPLKVVGLHSDEILLEQPEDPVPISTSEEIATGMMSILPIAAATTSSSLSSAVSSKPTTSVSEAGPAKSEANEPTPTLPSSSEKPSKSGEPENHPQATEPPQPEDPEPEDPGQPETPDNDKPKGIIGSLWSSISSSIDWIVNKVDDLVDTVVGGGS